MDKQIQEIQTRVLEETARDKNFGFALAGGTALERYYLKHRFSRDLDFFSSVYDPVAAERFMQGLAKRLGCVVVKEQEFIADSRARVIFYSLSGMGLKRPLKIDFVEEVLIEKPSVRRIDEVPVYSAEDIYFHKIVAISGSEELRDATGRVQATGRDEPRDAFDLYVLSTMITPLNAFLRTIPRMYQKRFIRWAQTYSRLDMKIGLLDLDIYLDGFGSREMIRHMDGEVKEFIGTLT